MIYTMLLWPHANARYRNETVRLAQSELEVMLARLSPQSVCTAAQLKGMPALELVTDEALSPGVLERICEHSLMYMLFEKGEDGALRPLIGRARACIGEDLPGILKYKGKTNETFTALLMNAALYASGFWRSSEEDLCVLDPMCGKGTGVFVAANRGWKSTGSDVDRADLRQAEQFLERYFKYHHVKHHLERGSLTVNGKARPVTDIEFAPDSDAWKSGFRGCIRFAEVDARAIRAAFGAQRFHLIVCDLPYGVQHGARGGNVEDILKEALPVWREALRPGGAIAVAMNAQTLKPDKVRSLMSSAGMTAMGDGPWLHFEHWVEQAVTRDIAVCCKN